MRLNEIIIIEPGAMDTDEFFHGYAVAGAPGVELLSEFKDYKIYYLPEELNNGALVIRVMHGEKIVGKAWGALYNKKENHFGHNSLRFQSFSIIRSHKGKGIAYHIYHTLLEKNYKILSDMAQTKEMKSLYSKLCKKYNGYLLEGYAKIISKIEAEYRFELAYAQYNYNIIISRYEIPEDLWTPTLDN